MQQNPVTLLLKKWPSRRAVLDDARAFDADLEMIAVHRWFQRGSIPQRHWLALTSGAKRRRIGVSANDLAQAHALAADRSGLEIIQAQDTHSQEATT